MSQLEPIEPFITQKRRFKPKIRDQITLDLEGERVRAEIMGVLNDNAVVAKVLTVPIAKTPHGVRKDDLVCARRSVSRLLNVECWQKIEDRELQQADEVARFEREERGRAAEEAAERIAALPAEASPEPGQEASTQATEPRRTVLGPRRSKVGRSKEKNQ